MRRNLILFGGLGLGLLIILIAILGINRIRYSATIDIQSIIPDDITITVDSKKQRSTGKVGVMPGKHTLKAERTGFATQNYTIELKDRETKVLKLVLVATNREGLKWLTDHPEAQYEAEVIGGKIFDDAVENSIKKTPLIAKLPMLRRDWRIDYGRSQKNPNDPDAVAITITYVNETSKQNALAWIRQQGYSPNDYEIIYKTPGQ